VISYSVVAGYQSFRGPCCLHLLDEVEILPQHYTASHHRHPESLKTRNCLSFLDVVNIRRNRYNSACAVNQ